MRTAIVVALIGLLAFVGSAEADVMVYSAITSASVSQDELGNDQNDSPSTSGATVTATLPAGLSSTTTTVLGNSGFSATFDQSRTGGPFDSAYGWTSSDFSASNDEPYSISGTFTNSGGRTSLEAYLYDDTAGTFLFHNYQENVGGTTLTLGNTAGNTGNSYLIGSLTGNLVAGHQYQWYAAAFMDAFPSADDGATASGFANLQFAATPAPEPASMLAWSLIAGVGAVGYRLRKRKVVSLI